jgi:hypothetical protein
MLSVHITVHPSRRLDVDPDIEDPSGDMGNYEPPRNGSAYHAACA